MSINSNGTNEGTDVLYIPDSFRGYPPHLFRLPYQYVDEIDRVLVPYGLIQDRIETVATHIFEDFSTPVTDKREIPLQLICVMKGAAMFTHDLVLRLQRMNRLSSDRSLMFNIHYVRIKSYTGTAKNDKTVFNAEAVDEIKNIAISKRAPVLVIEDIVDSGKTALKLLNYLTSDRLLPIVKFAVLCNKRVEKKEHVHIDYCCFDIPNRWVIGYGFDVDDRFRDISHICIYKQNEGKAQQH